MANIEARKDKNGNITSYRIKVFKGRDAEGKRLKPYCKTWKVPKGKNWSETKIQKELNKVATLFEDECKNGLVVDNRQNFAQYAEYVIDLKERTGIKHKTISLYKNLLQRINFAIGHIKLTDLRPQHLNLFYEELSKDGVNISTGGKLSAKTIREYHNLISTILDQAEKELLIPYNPATKATPPKLQRKEIIALEIEEIKRIFDILKDEPIKWRVAIHLLAASGCRRGELLGLKWGNIDFNKKQIFINNNILYSPDRGIYEDTPKTESSIRYISLPDETLRILKKYKIYYQKFKNSLGNKWSGSEYVLTQEYGQPMHPDSVTGYCKKLEQKYNNLAQKHGWEPVKLTPHIFRHSQASILIYLKMDIVLVSKRLGHAQVSTTSDIYSHILKEADAQAAAKLSSIF